jgi:DNA polymerase-3 subunit epsilon/ATP-dependent DNA helicase DinG
MSMKQTIIAIDLETTGLNPDRDAVIEIGLARFHGGREDARWSSFIHPGCRIPPVITQLTGINDAMVANAPRLPQVIAEVKEFVGGGVLLGHNVAFDLAFFKPFRLFGENEVIDTLELASALLPHAPRYALGALCAHLGIPLKATHRAMDDALAAYGLYGQLLASAESLPMGILADLVRYGQDVEWGGGGALQTVYAARLKKEGALVRAGQVRFPSLEPGPLPASRPVLSPREEPEPLDAEEIAGLVDEGGPFAKSFPGYEHRPQQMEMAAAVARAFSESRHLMVEAGTGTGKSLAYLIPAVQWALRNGHRVVVSTNTINLQDQLIRKDFPDLIRVLGVDAQAAVLKGRGNYLCPRKLEILRNHGPESAEEMRVLAKTLIWLTETTSGDRTEINLNGPGERSVWSRLSAEDEQCSPDTCRLFGRRACPFLRARQAAEEAHVLIVNHALLVADVAAENRVLPEYRYLIIDEGHQLEAAATDGLSFRCSAWDLERSIRELGGRRSGWLGTLGGLAKKHGMPADLTSFLLSKSDDLSAALEDALRDGRVFFEAVKRFVNEQNDGPPSEYTLQYRIIPAVRTQPGWEDVEEGWENLRLALSETVRLAGAIGERMRNAETESETEEGDISILFAGWARRMAMNVESLHQFVAKPNPQMIHWVELPRERDLVTLVSAPLHIGPLIERHIWHTKHAVVLTSATLTAAGEFDYLRDRLSADEADTLVVGSPFDYENSALLYLADDIPEPADARAYQHALNKGLINLCQATRGRTLVLFTSYAQMRSTAKAIIGPLSREGILIYEQGEGASRNALLETFRNAEQAVLLGTRSFWEGVDVPGQALSVLVIVRLPFDVPSDPIVAARSETFEQPFSQYSLPEAILRFRQGFGRLIRTKSDRGVAVILDRRVLTKSYGRSFIDSLPDCTRETGSLAALPARAVRWLNS